jgi:hypothetical protein
LPPRPCSLIAASVAAFPAQAAERPNCPVPSKADILRSSAAKGDKPAETLGSDQRVCVNRIPKGFTYGQVLVDRHDGIAEYSYQWSDDRDDMSRRHRTL